MSRSPTMASGGVEETPRGGVFLRSWIWAAMAILAVLWLDGCSLAGDITPPPALATAQMAEPLPGVRAEPIQLIPPDLPANLVMGEAIYLDKCAGCHGPIGLGDGELAAQLEFAPAPLGEPAFARQAAPTEWYQGVTLGNIDRFMPGFGSLSDEERWSVVGYAFSLSTTPDEIARGEALYDRECTACHSGEGPGRNLGAGRQLVERSTGELYATITEGVGERMPGFEETLSEDQRWAVGLFLQQRDLTAGVSQPEPVLGSEQELASQGQLQGQIRNGTSGASVPAQVEVSLRGFDGDQEAITRSTSADSEGRYTFADLEIVPGRLFFVSVEYQGVPFRSEVAHFIPEATSLDLPLTIYESSTDNSQLRVERLHLLFTFPTPNLARVLELWALQNPTDRVMARPEGVVQVSLPQGAVNLQFESGQAEGRYLLGEGGFADLAPLPPGQGIADLAFGFDLPYEGRLDFEQRLDHKVQAVVILIPPDGPKLRGEGVQDLGVQDMGGISLHSYVMEGLVPGQTLSLQLSLGLAQRLGRLQVPGLMLGAVALAAALLLAGLWWFRRGGLMRAAPAQPSRDDPSQALLLAIARLDDDFAAGRIEEGPYRRQREALKRQALDAMRGSRD